MYTRNIFVILTCIFFTEGYDYKGPYCTYRCGIPCGKSEVSEPISSTNLPGDYYWRDFYGVPPPDAYPIGLSVQYPQTYIGLVFDPSKNGTIVTTIYEELDYVYTVRNNQTTKINETIQILCTSLPGQLSWVKITEENVDEVTSKYSIVLGGKYMDPKNGDPVYPYVVKTDKDQISYAGFSHKLDIDVEFALMDGSSETTKEYMWLAYMEEEPESSPTTSKPSNGFFSHHYNYQYSPNSFIPNFATEIKIGSCSVCCSNNRSSEMKTTKINERLATSMAYFWKPYPLIDKKEAFKAGQDRYNDTVHVGQAYIAPNAWDVGSSVSLTSVTVQGAIGGYVEFYYYHILSSTSPEKLKWVKTSVDDFPNLDTNLMVYGGALANGTKAYVCRDFDGKDLYVGSAQVGKAGTYCTVLYGAVPNYEILMYDQE